MLEIITNNPFRILGVYSNSPIKEIIANKDKAYAHAKVNKTVSFPTDISFLLDEVARGTNEIDFAERAITLPIDKLKYSLFWFLRLTPIDGIALEHLQVKNISKSVEIFERTERLSSLLNRGVIAFIHEEYEVAIHCITKVIHEEDYLPQLVEHIAGASFHITEDEMAHLFIDELLNVFDIEVLIDLFRDNGVSSDDEDYLNQKAISNWSSYINAEISKAKNQSKDPESSYQAGMILMNKTKGILAKIREILPSNDLHYQTIADNLAKQILQCGINYFNDTDDNDAPFLSMTLQEYALEIAVGSITKNRCRENVEILKKIIQELPPKEVIVENKAIRRAIERCIKSPQNIDKVLTLIRECVPYLVSIKEKMGKDHSFYLEISTLVANVSLGVSIEILNPAIQANQSPLPSLSVNHCTSYYSLLHAKLSLKDLVSSAWHVILYLDKFDLEQGFKQDRFIPNKITLLDLTLQLRIHVSFSVSDVDLRTEEEIFTSCKTISDFDNYLHKYPNGKFSLKAKSSKSELMRLKEERDKADELAWGRCKSDSQYREYIKQYPDGEHADEAKKIIERNSQIGIAVIFIVMIAIVLFLVYSFWEIIGLQIILGFSGIISFIWIFGMEKFNGKVVMFVVSFLCFFLCWLLSVA